MKTKYLILAWLAWLVITGLVYLGYLKQEAELADWRPTLYEISSSAESYDLIIILWGLFGTGMLILLLMETFFSILYKLGLTKTHISIVGN
jgi:hypothetical protein